MSIYCDEERNCTMDLDNIKTQADMPSDLIPLEAITPSSTFKNTTDTAEKFNTTFKRPRKSTPRKYIKRIVIKKKASTNKKFFRGGHKKIKPAKKQAKKKIAKTIKKKAKKTKR